MADFGLGPIAASAGYRLTAFDSVGSTNAEAQAAARAGDPGRHWFVALQQTAGRGRRGRPWATPHGNLAASLLIAPEGDPAGFATLGFVAGVALSRALRAAAPEVRAALKWPNDVVVGDEKLAGILLERIALADGRPAVIAGIGVNTAAVPEGLPYPATALGAGVDAATLHRALSDAWVEVLALWRGGDGLASVLAEWRAAAAGIGAAVAVTQDGAVRRGVFEAIDDLGRLVIRGEGGGRVAITAGDVHFGTTAGYHGLNGGQHG